MKNFKQISEELAKKLGNEEPFFGKPSESFIHYSSLSGTYKDRYYDVYFKESESYKEIEIARTTENPDEIFKLIKKIEPKAQVSLTRITYEVVTI